jgi:hypothetical protein
MKPFWRVQVRGSSRSISATSTCNVNRKALLLAGGNEKFFWLGLRDRQPLYFFVGLGVTPVVSAV